MIFKSLIQKNQKPYLKESLYSILTKSLKKAAREQGLCELKVKLKEIVPDISDQYSIIKLDTTYIKTKVRNQHTFQISLVNEVIEKFDKPTIVDIGDSSGTHLQYIIGLFSKKKDVKCLSVNLDAKAVEKIKGKGLDAVHARAECLDKYNINTDIFLCFEILEHLMNPCQFLYNLATMTNARYLIITVPYLKNSRVGLHHIRADRKENVYAENTHIFELNPGDWKFIIKHSGWEVVHEDIYFQYPKRSFWRITKMLWKKYDFEGFYGMILKRDDTWSLRYMDW